MKSLCIWMPAVLMMSSTTASACIGYSHLKVRDVLDADAVVVGFVQDYNVVTNPSAELSAHYARVRMQVIEVSSGEVARELEFTWVDWSSDVLNHAVTSVEISSNLTTNTYWTRLLYLAALRYPSGPTYQGESGFISRRGTSTDVYPELLEVACGSEILIRGLAYETSRIIRLLSGGYGEDVDPKLSVSSLPMVAQ